tara:strand:- start:618 stop:953 length:336 start_codon:yes stop_codon:yes gene_type:complete
MLKMLLLILLVFSNFSYADTNLKMYSCSEKKNKLYVSFNDNNKTAMVGMGEQKKYSVQIDFIYWDTVSYQNNDTLLRSVIFHKPTGRMSVNTYNSKLKNNKMVHYQCTLMK